MPLGRDAPISGSRRSCSPRPTPTPTGSPVGSPPAPRRRYEAVRAIEHQLRSGYNYSPNVPERTYPLASFLFEDRAGYCQQYAGAMALMLRMLGIPSRVVSGFAPGTLTTRSDEVYEIRDLDAHSWVEVYFRGIGWVTFDPTPAAAPAASQAATTSARHLLSRPRLGRRPGPGSRAEHRGGDRRRHRPRGRPAAAEDPGVRLRWR